jgi:hypothetical protein
MYALLQSRCSASADALTVAALLGARDPSTVAVSGIALFPAVLPQDSSLPLSAA